MTFDRRCETIRSHVMAYESMAPDWQNDQSLLWANSLTRFAASLCHMINDQKMQWPWKECVQQILGNSCWFDQNLNSAPKILEPEKWWSKINFTKTQNVWSRKERWILSSGQSACANLFKDIKVIKYTKINKFYDNCCKTQEVDGSYLLIKWAGAASSSLHSSHWSFPARAIIISSGYDQYYWYDLLLLFNYHLFLIITLYIYILLIFISIIYIIFPRKKLW